MPTINELIRVNVTRQTTAVPQAGFGTILVLSYETPPGGFSGSFAAVTEEDWATSFQTTTDVYKILNKHFSQARTPTRAIVGYRLTGDATVSAALNRIYDASEGGFYCICPVGTTDVDELEEISTWAEGKGRICFIQSFAATAYATPDEEKTATEIGDKLKNSSITRTAVFYTTEEDDHITGAITGLCLPAPAGSITFAYKELAGVTKATLTGTQITNLDNKNYNYYRNFAGTGSTFGGKMANGGFIDIIRDTDWITARVQEAVALQLKTTDKIPYTEDGANIIENSLRMVLEQAVTQGVLDTGYTVERESINGIPLNDRAQRKFPQITVTGRYSGAIHSVAFQLTLSV